MQLLLLFPTTESHTLSLTAMDSHATLNNLSHFIQLMHTLFYTTVDTHTQSGHSGVFLPNMRLHTRDDVLTQHQIQAHFHTQI